MSTSNISARLQDLSIRGDSSVSLDERGRLRRLVHASAYQTPSLHVAYRDARPPSPLCSLLLSGASVRSNDPRQDARPNARTLRRPQESNDEPFTWFHGWSRSGSLTKYQHERGMFLLSYGTNLLVVTVIRVRWFKRPSN